MEWGWGGEIVDMRRGSHPIDDDEWCIGGHDGVSVYGRFTWVTVVGQAWNKGKVSVRNSYLL